jgi:hypothetical protein
VEGKYACVDLTGVFPLVGLTTMDFTVGHAVLKAALNQVTKHKKTCSDNQYAIIHIVFDTFSFLTPEAVNILKKVQRIMHSKLVSPRSQAIVFKRIDFTIQNRLAT